MSIALRLHAPGGALIAGLPLAMNIAAMTEHNAPGLLTFGYPLAEAGPLLAAPAGYLVLVEDGAERPDRYLLGEDGETPSGSDGSVLQVTASCPGYLAYLRYGAVYPQRHTPGAPVAGLDPRWSFKRVTPGAMMATLIAAAQARGALPYLDCGFTAAADSAGAPWPVTYSVVFDVQTLDQVLDKILTDRWADARMTGTTLHLYAPDTVCAADRPGAVLRLGREVRSAPRQRARLGAPTHMLALGIDRTGTETADPAALARYSERREGFTDQNEVRDAETLAALARTQLEAVSATPEALDLDLATGTGGPAYGADYTVGDRIRYDQRRIAGELESLRLRSATESWAGPGAPKALSVSLNDQFTELSAMLTKRMERLRRGSRGSAPPVTGAPTPGGTGGDAPVPGTLGYDGGGAGLQYYDGSTWNAVAGGAAPQPVTATGDYGYFYFDTSSYSQVRCQIAVTATYLDAAELAADTTRFAVNYYPRAGADSEEATEVPGTSARIDPGTPLAYILAYGSDDPRNNYAAVCLISGWAPLPAAARGQLWWQVLPADSIFWSFRLGRTGVFFR